MKKALVVLLVVASAALVGYVFYTFSGLGKQRADLFNCIHSDAAFVMHVSGFDGLEKYLPWLDEMAGKRSDESGVPLNPLVQWPQALRALDSLYDVSDAWKNALEDGAVFSSTASGRGDMWMLTVHYAEGMDAMPWPALTGKKRSFKGTDIAEHAGGFFSAKQGDVWCLATAASMLEEVILSKEKQQSDVFEKARSLASSDVPMHFYAPVADQQGWVQLDPLFTTETLKLSGYFVPSATAHSLLQFTPGKGTRTVHVAKYLPANTSTLCVWSAADVATALANAEQFYQDDERAGAWSAANNSYSDSCNCRWRDAASAWRGAEWGTAIVSKGDSIHSTVAFYEKADTLSIVSAMQPLLADSFAMAGVYPVRYPQVFDLWSIQLENVPHRFMRESKHFVFFADAPEALIAIGQTADSTGLLREPAFAALMAHMEEETECVFYRTHASATLLPEAMSRAFAAAASECLTVKTGGGSLPLLNLHFPVEVLNAVPEAVQNTSAETTNASDGSKRWSVLNHSTQATETVVLNDAGQLQWISAVGTTAWSRDGFNTLTGDVVQVDLLRNGKLQLLLATNDKLYAIDRNGQDVAGFPVSLASPLMGAPVVFDYEKNKNYRFMVPLQNGEVMNITNNGTPAEGWKYAASAPVIWMHHVRFGTEDHLLFALNDGRMLDLKRNGTLRSVMPTKMPAPQGPITFESGSTLESCVLRYKTASGEAGEYKF